MINSKKTVTKEAARTYSLYNGEIKLTFKPSGHRYDVNGTEVVGVTTVLKTVIAKEAITAWAVKLAAEYMTKTFLPDKPYTVQEIGDIIAEAKRQYITSRDEAAQLGVDVHKIIEDYINAKIANSSYEIPTDIKNAHKMALNSFFEWERQNDVKWEASEKIVYSKRYNYAGTLDILATVRGIRTLIDLKTSNAIYPESYFLQVCAYKYAYEEEKPDDPIPSMMILRIPKTKDDAIETVFVPDYIENAKAFIYALALYNRITFIKNTNKIKNNGRG